MADNGATILVMKIITIVVAVLMIATVALPAVEDATTELKTVSQNTGETYTYISDASVEATYEVVYSDSVLTVNDEVIAVPSGAYTYVAFADTFFLQWTGSSMRMYYDSYTGDNVGVTSVTFANGTASWTSNSEDYTSDYTWLFIADNNGDYGVFEGNDPVYFNSDSVLFYLDSNWSGFTNSDLTPSSVTMRGVEMRGPYDNMKMVWGTTNTVGITSVISGKFAITNVTDHHNGSYSLVPGTATIVTEVTTDVGTYSKTETNAMPSICAPLEYWYASDSASSMINLLNVIPILLILVPVMMAVRMMALKRN